MTSNVPTQYHVNLGGQDLILRPGSYRRRAAPMFGARFTSGDPDWNTLTFWQHWAQSCWIGGLGQELWRDDSMFDEAVGVDTSLHDRMQLSRGLVQPDASWLVQSAAFRWGRFFCEFGNDLYCMLMNQETGYGPYPNADGYLYKYTVVTDLWTLVKTFTASYVRSIFSWGGRLLVGTSGSVIHTFDGTTWVDINVPAADVSTIYSMASYRDRLYCGFGSGKIWRLKSDWTWDGTTFFYENPGLGGYVTSMEVHLGFLYMITSFGTILRTDGNNTFDLWDFPAGTRGGGLRSYDGKLFVSVTEGDGTDTASQGVLYQFTGSAVTELHRWGRLGQNGGLGHLAVHDRRMYYGASSLLGMQDGFGIAVYDSVEDAHSIFACNSSGSYPDILDGYGWIVDDIIDFKGRLFCSVRGYGIFRTPVTFRDYMFERSEAQYDVTGAALEYPGGWLTSSNFDAGTPGVDKLWQSIRVDAELPSTSTSIYVDYSIDDGRVWVSGFGVAGVSGVLNPPIRFFLTDLVSRRFKWRVRLVSTDEDYTPVVHAVIVSYLPLIDPNWQWQFTAVVSDTMELVDGTLMAVNTLTKLAALRSLWRDQRVIDFTDIDGSSSLSVFVMDYDERVIHPEQPTEAEVSVVLIESEETTGSSCGFPSGTYPPPGGGVAASDGYQIEYSRAGVAQYEVPHPGFVGDWHFPIWGLDGVDYGGGMGNSMRVIVSGNGLLVIPTHVYAGVPAPWTAWMWHRDHVTGAVVTDMSLTGTSGGFATFLVSGADCEHLYHIVDMAFPETNGGFSGFTWVRF